MEYQLIPLTKYQEFCYKHWPKIKNQRFGQAFMNHFNIKENQGIYDTIWNSDFGTTKDLIEEHLIDWEN